MKLGGVVSVALEERIVEMAKHVPGGGFLPAPRGPWWSGRPLNNNGQGRLSSGSGGRGFVGPVGTSGRGSGCAGPAPAITNPSSPTKTTNATNTLTVFGWLPLTRDLLTSQSRSTTVSVAFSYSAPPSRTPVQREEAGRRLPIRAHLERRDLPRADRLRPEAARVEHTPRWRIDRTWDITL